MISEAGHGYRLRPEDFVDGGAYNSRNGACPEKPSATGSTSSPASCAKRQTARRHVPRRRQRAMMFLGDQWIGTEPYKDGFDELGLDAVVGSIGDGTTTCMIADIPGVRAKPKAASLPALLPRHVLRGQRIRASKASTTGARPRRAILRSPISCMGYGGYLSWPPSSRSSWTR